MNPGLYIVKMKLNNIDLNYINHRMEMYDIKYQEIYDEIKDHMVSAVETARAGGDERNVVYVFDELMEAHFPGFWAFQNISKEYEMAYRAKLRRTLWSNFGSYLSWQVIGLVILLVIIGFYLPNNKVTYRTISVFMMILMVVVAVGTQFYAWWQGRKIRLDKGKQSMVKNHVARYGAFLILIVNLLLNCMGFFGREYNIHWLNPRYFHPVFWILLLSFFILYSLSSTRLCRQELKLG